MIYVLLVLMWILAVFNLAQSAKVKKNKKAKLWLLRTMMVLGIACLLVMLGATSTTHGYTKNEAALNEVEKRLDKTDFLLYAVDALHNTNNNKEDLELVVDRTKEILYKINNEQKAEFLELKAKNMNLSMIHLILTGKPIEE